MRTRTTRTASSSWSHLQHHAELDPAPQVSTGGPGWALLAPLFVSSVLLVVAVFRLDAPFGPNFEGFNTAVWAEGSRAVRADGWFDSRLGAITPDSRLDKRAPYAHHPPLLRVEVATTEVVLGESRWVTRLPALLSSLAAIWLCWAWLGSLRLGSSARAFGVLAVGSTSMFMLYGLMLNMEAIWLPLSFATLWRWQIGESHTDDRGARGAEAAVSAAVGLGTALAAHQGILLVGILASVGVVRAIRGSRRLQANELGMLVAAVLGAVLFVAWILWAVGSLSDIVEIARIRSGGAGSSLPGGRQGWARWPLTQFDHARATLRWLGIMVLLAGPFLVRRRPQVVVVMTVTWAVAALYAVVFRQGAFIHPYWNVALLAPLGLGAALVAERASEFGVRVVAGLQAVAVLAVLSTAVTTVQVGRIADATGNLARVAGEQSGPLYTTDLIAAWLRYESGRDDIGALSSCRAVRHVAERSPEALVLTQRAWPPLTSEADWSEVVSAPSARTLESSVLIRAEDLAAVCD